MKVSIVIPMLNEEEVVETLLRRIIEMRESAAERYEIVIVDDGSTDRTLEKARALLGAKPDWQIIQLSRNFGQQAAYLAGIEEATGDAVVLLDADLQDPPELIPKLVEKWRAGAKVVAAVRRSRTESGVRGMSFHLFHSLFFRCTGGVMPKNSGSFGIMDRAVVERIKAMPERNLFLPALRSWVGFEQDTLIYDREARFGGPAKQNYKRLMRLAWDGITSFSSVPLKLVGWLGLAIASTGFLYALWLIALKFLQMGGYFHELEVLGFTTLAVAVLTLGGIQLICLGVLGEYISRIYIEVKGRPRYVIARRESAEGAAF